jgi:hypothetical protein
MPFSYKRPAVSKRINFVERMGMLRSSASRMVSGAGFFPRTMMMAAMSRMSAVRMTWVLVRPVSKRHQISAKGGFYFHSQLILPDQNIGIQYFYYFVQGHVDLLLESFINGLLQIHPSQNRLRSPLLSGENNFKKADYLSVDCHRAVYHKQGAMSNTLSA